MEAIRERIENVPVERITATHLIEKTESSHIQYEGMIDARYTIVVEDRLEDVSDEDFISYYKTIVTRIPNPKEYFGELCEKISIRFPSLGGSAVAYINVEMKCDKEQTTAFVKAHRAKAW